MAYITIDSSSRITDARFKLLKKAESGWNEVKNVKLFDGKDPVLVMLHNAKSAITIDIEKSTTKKFVVKYDLGNKVIEEEIVIEN